MVDLTNLIACLPNRTFGVIKGVCVAVECQIEGGL